jgi:hypothetical protein
MAKFVLEFGIVWVTRYSHEGVRVDRLHEDPVGKSGLGKGERP